MASTAPLVPVYTALFGGVRLLTTEPILMMLAPSPRCLTAACVVSRRPSTLMLKYFVKLLFGDGLDRRRTRRRPSC